MPFHFIVDSISELSVIAPVLRILCFYRFPFSSIATAHTFLQGWINPGCFAQFSTSSSKRSLWVNKAQKFCFPVRPYQIWIFWFNERPVLLRDFISKNFTVKFSKISVGDGRVSRTWKRRCFPRNIDEAMIADGNMGDTGTAYPV